MLSLKELVAGLDGILEDFERAQAEHAPAAEAVAAEHREGALNLVRYTALRHRDIRELQHGLLDLGATSLSTAEPDVRAMVQAARDAVGALAGDAGRWDSDVINDALDRGDALLDANVEAVLGSLRPRSATRIMVTLPREAAPDPALVAGWVEAGMDIAHIDCADDDESAWAAMAENVRTAAKAADRSVLVSMGLPALTDEDASPLPLIAEHADLVAASFIRNADDVAHVLDALTAAGGRDLGLILKIETLQGFENMSSILLEGMRHPRLAVMIARGGPAVDVGVEGLSEGPQQILNLCAAGHIPTIWASRVPELLAKSGQSLRAEISYAAAGQQADCVLLN